MLNIFEKYFAPFFNAVVPALIAKFMLFSLQKFATLSKILLLLLFPSLDSALIDIIFALGNIGGLEGVVLTIIGLPIYVIAIIYKIIYYKNNKKKI